MTPNTQSVQSEQREELNRRIRTCTRCDLAEMRRHAVCGEGNWQSRLFLIKQAPDTTEDLEGRMTVGSSKAVLDELLHEGGISWNDFFATNLLKCRLVQDRQPKQAEIDACSLFLHEEIRLCEPKILVPLGYHAAQHLFSWYGNMSISRNDYPSMIGTLYLVHDMTVFPLPEPYLAVPQHDTLPAIRRMWKKLAVLKQRCIWQPVCPITRYTNMGRIDTHWARLYCQGDWASCIRYQMEERGAYHPDTMLPDGSMME